MSSIGERIKALRIQQRIRQEELAEYVGVNIKTIQRWESAGANPKMDKLKLIAEALGTNVAYLTGESDIPPQGLSNNAIWLLNQKRLIEKEANEGEAGTGLTGAPRISQATLDLEAMIKDLAYDYPDLAIGFRDTRQNWGSLSDNDKASIAEALMMIFRPESYVPQRLNKEGRFGDKV